MSSFTYFQNDLVLWSHDQTQQHPQADIGGCTGGENDKRKAKNGVDDQYDKANSILYRCVYKKAIYLTRLYFKCLRRAFTLWCSIYWTKTRIQFESSVAPWCCYCRGKSGEGSHPHRRNGKRPSSTNPRGALLSPFSRSATHSTAEPWVSCRHVLLPYLPHHLLNHHCLVLSCLNIHCE